MELIVSILYVSLLLELNFFHVPSVANTHVFFTDNLNIINDYNKYQYVFKWNKQQKFLFLLIPHLLNIIAFFTPLLLAFFIEKEWSFFIVFGVLLAIIGRVISFYAMLQIRKNNSQQNKDFTLHTKGIFSISRNPIQLGMYIFYIGLITIISHWILIFTLLFYFLYNDFRIKIEEDFLEVKFKELYKNYKLKTRRYL